MGKRLNEIASKTYYGDYAKDIYWLISRVTYLTNILERLERSDDLLMHDWEVVRAALEDSDG